jgi:hypothetical protein
MHATEKIIQWIQEQPTDKFTNAGRELLMDWVNARKMHMDEWARYNFNDLTCFDIETTSPAEGSHHGIKSDPDVHSHAELSHLLMADIRRVRQLYFTMERECASRTLEEATNVRTIVETMAHKHFVLQTCQDFVVEFIESFNYNVSKKRADDDDEVVALVWRRRVASSSEETPPPYTFSRIRVIRKVQNCLICCCCATQVHGRPCRHLLAYNEGLVDVDDFHDCHLKKYAAHPFKPKPYIGVRDRRQLRELPELEKNAEDGATFVDACEGNGNDFDNEDAMPRRRKRRGFCKLKDEFKRILDKWGNHPMVLQKFFDSTRAMDESLGDVSTYRSGRASSKPTPQGSRSHRR